MKKYLLTTVFTLISLFVFSQKNIDKMMDKYNVQTIKFLDHTFSVGDTLSFTSGSLPNGEFVCTMLSPDLLLKPGVTPPHLPANYTNYRFIISKIRENKDQLNSYSSLVFYISEKVMVWVDLNLAITKKEIMTNENR